MIKYIGSKRTLLGDLVAVLKAFPEFDSVIDLFSGTSRVGHAMKKAGYRVLSNDHNGYAHTLATCYVEADREQVERDAAKLLAEFTRIPGRPGYFTDTFCAKSRFFQPHNGERIDAIRDEIERKDLDPVLKSVVLVSLMEAADRVDSTCGLQMAYVKKWAPRSYNDLELRMPDVLPAVPAGRCEAYRMEAHEAAESLSASVAYVDPPYNQHSYLCNYHIWETLVLWDKPEVYGVACKRMDCRERKSVFNSRPGHVPAFTAVIDALKTSLLVVSFNNEGYQTREQMEAILARRGRVFVITKDFKRYVGAQIGIYNPSGERVGEVSHLRNEEYIYLVATENCPDRAAIEERLAALAAAAAAIPASAHPTLSDQHRAVDRRGPDSARPEQLAARVLEHLVAHGTASAREIEQEVGVGAYRIRQALQVLLQRGTVRMIGERRGAKYAASGASVGPGPEAISGRPAGPVDAALAKLIVDSLRSTCVQSIAQLAASTGADRAPQRVFTGCIECSAREAAQLVPSEHGPCDLGQPFDCDRSLIGNVAQQRGSERGQLGRI